MACSFRRFLRDIGYVKLQEEHLPTSYSPEYYRLVVMAGPTPASSMFTPRRRVVGKWQRRTIMRFVAKIGLAYYPGQRHGELLLEQLRESLCGGGFDLYFRGCVLVHMGKDFWQRFEDESVSMFSFFYFLLSASVGQSGGPFLGEGIPVPI